MLELDLSQSTNLPSLNFGPTITEVQASRVKALLCAVGKNPAAFGLSEGECLMALGSGRDWFNPFFLFTAFWGGCMRFLGVTLTTGFSFIAAFYLLFKAGKKITDFISWGKKMIGTVMPWAAAGSGWLNDGIAKDSELSGAAVYSAVKAFLPGQVGGLIETAVEKIDASLADEAVSYDASGGALRNYHNWLSGTEDLAPDTIDSVSRVTGQSRDDLYRELSAN